MKSRILILVAATLMLAGSTAKATVTDNFAGLLTELQARSQALSNFVSTAGLSNSVKKVAVAQKKACDKSIQTINKADAITGSTALAKGLVAAGQVATTLRKPFATELADTNARFAVGSFTSTQNLGVLLANTFTAFAGDVDDQLAGVDLTGITGTAQTKIQALIDKANVLLNQLEGTDLTKATKLISGALKDATSALKAVVSANNHPSGGGGGGSTGGAGMHCKINGVSFSATAIGTVGVYVSQTGELAITGGTTTKAVTIIAANVTGPGDYPAALGTVSEFTNDPLNSTNFLALITGTLHITAFTPGGLTASGTFSFSASQSTPTPNPDNVDNVTEGTFTTTHVFNQ